MASKARKNTIDEKEWSAHLDGILERDREFLEAIGRL